MRIFAEVSRQQVRVVREHLPQQRKQSFVRDDALPRRFEPAYARVFQFGREHLAQHILPRVELEQVANHLILQVGKLTFFTQADIFDIQKLGGHTRFCGTVLQILNGTAIFFGIATAGHMQQLEAKLFAQLGKTLDQLFLQAVELVAACWQLAGVDLIFQPNPLEKGGFIQRGRGVGVVLQQLRFAHAVPCQIETRVERRLVGFPRLANEAPGVFRNAELRHQFIAGDDFFHRLQTHLVQPGGDLFKLFNLRQRQFVIGFFAPVRLAIHGMKVEAVFGRLLTPVRALRDADSFHVI